MDRRLREDDICILVRPPSLTIQNVQPVRVKKWSHHALGIHPELFGTLHGDYDGDEAHLYPIASEKSIAEARNWLYHGLKTIAEGRRTFNSNFGSVDLDYPSSMQFMNYTTLSCRELSMADPPSSMFGKFSKNSDDSVRGLSKRFGSISVANTFVRGSVRGVNDIMIQRLSQSKIGDMSRIARIGARCFYRDSEGVLCIASRVPARDMDVERKQDSGTPSVRAVMKLCSRA